MPAFSATSWGRLATCDARLRVLFAEIVELPEMFWVAWGGVVAVYSVGRTTELIRTNKARTQ